MNSKQTINGMLRAEAAWGRSVRSRRNQGAGKAARHRVPKRPQAGERRDRFRLGKEREAGRSEADRAPGAYRSPVPPIAGSSAHSPGR